jgi:hypothetical protein
VIEARSSRPQLHSGTFLPLWSADSARAPRNPTDGDFLDRALNIHSALGSIIGEGHARGWMMLAGQPEHDELEARRARFDIRAGREPAVSRMSATAGGEDQPDAFGGIDRSPHPPAPSARAFEIKIDQDHRIPVAGESLDRRRARGGLTVAAVAASIGLASVGMAGGYFLFGYQTASSTPPPPSPDRSTGATDSSKGDRLPVHQTIIRQIDRTAPEKLPHSRNLLASKAIARAKPSSAIVPPVPAAGHHATAAPPPPTSTADNAAKPHVEARLTPVPDTRPTTIDGWTLREVVDGTAVLEGPGGVLRVRRGDTVPGVGRVVAILRWGNRLIVATSRGFISTP